MCISIHMYICTLLLDCYVTDALTLESMKIGVCIYNYLIIDTKLGNNQCHYIVLHSSIENVISKS